jgi:hypothetical protein
MRSRGITILLIIIISVFLSGIVFLPTGESAINDHSIINYVKIFYGNNKNVTFTGDYQALTLPEGTILNRIEINTTIMGTDKVLEIGYVVHLRSSPLYGYDYIGTGETSVMTDLANGTVFNYTFPFSPAGPFTLNKSGIWDITIKNDYSIEYLSNNGILVNFQTWNDAVIVGGNDVFEIRPDSMGIGKNIVYFAWLLIIFFPAIILNSFIPKIGFIMGVGLMTTILVLGDVIHSWWFFLIIMMGITLLVFRGDE